MKHLSTKTALVVCLALIAAAFTACDMMHEDRDDCPTGLYVMFKYDYNLQRADMFNDHVGSVTLYIFDEQGRLVKTQEESNTATSKPLKDHGYRMHVTGLPAGKYQFIALAGQDSYTEQLATNRAKFVRKDMASGSQMTDLEVLLDHVQATAAEAAKYGSGKYVVQNNALPLDTLWHGIDTRLIEVTDTRPTYDTISLVRDTKRILVTLREVPENTNTPSAIDVNDYDFRIEDKNTHILWDNSLDETDAVVYTPYYTYNATDREPTYNADGTAIGTGQTALAEFMTSRILYHENNDDDARLIVTSKETGKEVININLADLLQQLRYAADIPYKAQVFLDRGYDFQLHFFLQKGEMKYVDISIDVLSWAVRRQFEELTK